MFHVHIFFSFLLTCLLLCVFVKKILGKINFSNYNQFWALLVSAIFGLLCANAETVNYIIQRAEIVAGLYILAGFVAFLQGGAWRSKYIYLLFPFIGFFAKEMAFVFSPLLLLYVMIFEENADLLHFYRKEEFKKCWRSFMKILPSFILTIAFYVFYTKMLPDTFSAGGTDRFKYLITQPMVMCHYLVTYFVPYNLSADTDWTVYNSLSDYRAIVGIAITCFLVYLALKASANKETRLFSFGLLWFFISLLPTSSFIAFAEVLNDHRCFIPYLGLTISFVFGSKYLVEKYFPKGIKQKSTHSFLIVVLILFLGSNAYGVYQRNKVWKSEETLWYDVTIKSPQNGRGLMNYGLTQMAKGNYTNAIAYFDRAKVFTPNYYSLFINIGIAKGAVGKHEEAIASFEKAITLSPNSFGPYAFYARYLSQNRKYNEAKLMGEKSLQIDPNSLLTLNVLMEVYQNLGLWNDLERVAKHVLDLVPDDKNALNYLNAAKEEKSPVEMALEAKSKKGMSAEDYLNLSLTYYNAGKFEKCIEACESALKLKPDYADAYSNMGASYNMLKQWDKGIEACKKALEINPKHRLAQGNLAWALKENQK
ncbi:MAG: tetratricopeptide repeat protein [Flavobacterium sp.]|nr:MAG: tetratricopeptide repeat protein [Flavobacterium sp.]